jgi:hypothetical protein
MKLKKLLTLKGDILYLNRKTTEGAHKLTADRRNFFFSLKIIFLSIKCHNSPRTAVKIFGFSMHETNTFNTM